MKRYFYSIIGLFQARSGLLSLALTLLITIILVLNVLTELNASPVALKVTQKNKLTVSPIRQLQRYSAFVF